MNRDLRLQRGQTYRETLLLITEQRQLRWRGGWVSDVEYDRDDAVLDSAGNPWLALITATGIDPTADAAPKAWSAVAVFDLTGCTLAMSFGGLFTLTSGSGLTLGRIPGAVDVTISPTQTNQLVDSVHRVLTLTDAAARVSFPDAGTVIFADA